MSPRRWLAIAGGALGALLLLAVGIALTVLPAARDLRDAEELLDRAALALEGGELEQADRLLARAEGLVIGANESLRTSVPLGLVRGLPVVSDNLASLEASVTVAARIAHGGRRVLRASAPLEGDDGRLEVALRSGQLDLEAVTDTQSEIAHLSSQLRLPAATRSERLLLGPVRDLQERLDEQLAVRRQQLDVLGRGLGLLRELAGAEGDRRYLIAVANTAEMRGSGGMILSYGVLEGREGGFDLREFGRIDELALGRPVTSEAAGIPADHLARWDGFDPYLRWRNATVGADFSVTAPLLLAMYEQVAREPVHGVVQVDPQGLAAILAGVGPVTVPELGEVRDDNVVDLVLNQAYVRFPDIDDRSDVLGDVAEAAFERLVEGDVPSLRVLAEAVVAAVDGGHIRMSTRSSAAQAQLVYFGADGSLPDPERDHLHLTVQNVAGNKLDYYVDTGLAVSGSRPPGEPGRLTVAVEVANRAPTGVTEPRYVFGPNLAGQEAGLYRGVVSLYVPVGTALRASSGGPVRDTVAEFVEDGRPVVSWTVDLPAGSSSSVVLELDLAPRPREPYEVLVTPSPRVRPTQLDLEVDAGGPVAAGSVALDRAWVFPAGGPPQARGAGAGR